MNHIGQLAWTRNSFFLKHIIALQLEQDDISRGKHFSNIALTIVNVSSRVYGSITTDKSQQIFWSTTEEHRRKLPEFWA